MVTMEMQSPQGRRGLWLVVGLLILLVVLLVVGWWLGQRNTSISLPSDSFDEQVVTEGRISVTSEYPGFELVKTELYPELATAVQEVGLWHQGVINGSNGSGNVIAKELRIIVTDQLQVGDRLTNPQGQVMSSMGYDVENIVVTLHIQVDKNAVNDTDFNIDDVVNTALLRGLYLLTATESGGFEGQLQAALQWVSKTYHEPYILLVKKTSWLKIPVIPKVYAQTDCERWQCGTPTYGLYCSNDHNRPCSNDTNCVSPGTCTYNKEVSCSPAYWEGDSPTCVNPGGDCPGGQCATNYNCFCGGPTPMVSVTPAGGGGPSTHIVQARLLLDRNSNEWPEENDSGATNSYIYDSSVHSCSAGVDLNPSVSNWDIYDRNSSYLWTYPSSCYSGTNFAYHGYSHGTDNTHSFQLVGNMGLEYRIVNWDQVDTDVFCDLDELPILACSSEWGTQPVDVLIGGPTEPTGVCRVGLPAGQVGVNISTPSFPPGYNVASKGYYVWTGCPNSSRIFSSSFTNSSQPLSGNCRYEFGSYDEVGNRYHIGLDFGQPFNPTISCWVSCPAPASAVVTDTACSGGTRNVTWNWGAVTGATSYQLQIDNNSNFSSPERDTPVAGTSYTWNSMPNPGTTRYARVKVNASPNPSCAWRNLPNYSNACPVPTNTPTRTPTPIANTPTPTPSVQGFVRNQAGGAMIAGRCITT